MFSLDASPKSRSRQVSAIPLNYVMRVLRHLRPHWSLALVSLGLTLLSSLAALLTPWPLKIVVDNVLERHPLPAALAGLLGQGATHRTELLLLAVLGGLLVAPSRNVLQTTTLLDALAEFKFEAALGGARRDEAKARAKERFFAPRPLRAVGPEEAATGAVVVL